MALTTSLTLAAFGIITPLDKEMDHWLETHEYKTVPKHQPTQLTDQEHKALDSLTSSRSV